MGTVIVHPEDGWMKEVAQELLSLAESPYEVEYVMWPRPGFRVPDYVFEAFEKAQVGGGVERIPAPSAVVGSEMVGEIVGEVLTGLTNGVAPIVFEVPAEVVEPVKRKPGRPKKNTEGQ